MHVIVSFLVFLDSANKNFMFHIFKVFSLVRSYKMLPVYSLFWLLLSRVTQKIVNEFIIEFC